MTLPAIVEMMEYPGITLNPKGIIILKNSSGNERRLLKKAVMERLPASAIAGPRIAK